MLKHIDLTIQSGEIVGYIGPNGAGKSTTIKIPTGIIPDFQGEATVLGYDIQKEPLEVKRQIGYIPENAALYDTLTPLEYLHFIGRSTAWTNAWLKTKARELLQLFDLSEYVDSRMTTFSKGMRQKVLLIAGYDPQSIHLVS